MQLVLGGAGGGVAMKSGSFSGGRPMSLKERGVYWGESGRSFVEIGGGQERCGTLLFHRSNW